MKTNDREKYLKRYSYCLLFAAGSGLIFWLLWQILASFYWLFLAEKDASYQGITLWSEAVVAVALLAFLLSAWYQHRESLAHTIEEDQAVIVKRLTRHGVRRSDTLYQGWHELPFASWIGSRITLKQCRYHANEVVVWIEGHAARIQAQVALHVIDPATYDRSHVALQPIFYRALANEVVQFSCHEVISQPQQVNQAVLTALNTELLVYGLRADEYAMLKLCWVESGGKHHFPAPRS